MKRAEMIDYIIKHSSEEFETSQDYIELAKLSNHELRLNIISINNYLLGVVKQDRDMLLAFLKCYNNGQVTEYGIQEVDNFLKANSNNFNN